MLDFYLSKELIFVLPFIWALGLVFKMKNDKNVKIYTIIGIATILAYIIRVVLHLDAWPLIAESIEGLEIKKTNYFMLSFEFTKLPVILILINYFVAAIFMVVCFKENVYKSRLIGFLQLTILGISTLAICSTNIFQFYFISELVIFLYILLARQKGGKFLDGEALTYSALSFAMVMIAMVLLLVIGRNSFGPIELTDAMVKKTLLDFKFADERRLIGAMLLGSYLIKFGLFPLDRWMNRIGQRVGGSLLVFMLVVYSNLFVFGFYKYFVCFFQNELILNFKIIMTIILFLTFISFKKDKENSRNIRNVFFDIVRTIIILMLLSPNLASHEGAFYVLLASTFIVTTLGLLNYLFVQKTAGISISTHTILNLLILSFPFSPLIAGEIFFISAMLKNGTMFLIASLFLLLFNRYIFIQKIVAYNKENFSEGKLFENLNWIELAPLILILGIVMFLGAFPETIISFYRMDLRV